jgi:VRR-NUC domain-containing protein
MVFHPFDSRRSMPGFPDIVMVRPPSVLFVETKTDRGRMTPAQQVWMQALQQCPGIETYVWRPDDWDGIVSRLKYVGQAGTSRDPVA